MKTMLVKKDGKIIIECTGGTRCIRNDQDALELVAACGEYNTNLLLIHAENLTNEFYQLHTGVAGSILLKFVNYSIKAAAILSPKLVNQGKFQEMVIETNRGRDFRVFYNRENAEEWLFSF
jgi:PadR family transcriptional regulator, regulatory protein AphA